MIVIGIDPGKMCGTAVYYVEGNSLAAREVTFEDFGNWLNTTLSQLRDHETVLVACERFTILADTYKKSADAHWALEAIGVARYLSYCYGRPFHQNQVTPVKQFAKDAQMREAGWYIVGKGHATDAVRHVIYTLADVCKYFPAWIDENHAKLGHPVIATEINWAKFYRMATKLPVDPRAYRHLREPVIYVPDATDETTTNA